MYSATSAFFKNRNIYKSFDKSFDKSLVNIKRIANFKALNYGLDIPDENIYTKHSDTLKNSKKNLKNKTCTVLGYGPQGQSQALNIRDSGIKVCVGVRKNGASWHKAIQDKFIPGKSLFPLEEAVNKGEIIMFLLSDAGQIDVYQKIRSQLYNKTLYFSHGFGVVYKSKTKMDVDNLENTDIIMVAPKGSGKTVRELYKQGHGINSSIAIYKDASGYALENVLSLGFAIGSQYLYETTFEKEVTSDLTGERSILMGGIAGLFKAQYDVLRTNGHSPSEAFNETVEEALQSLYPLINEKGMEYMFSNCSTTAQRGALDWTKRFETLNKPLIEEIYRSVINGEEADKTINANSSNSYREKLTRELDELNANEIWKVGKVLRELRIKK